MPRSTERYRTEVIGKTPSRIDLLEEYPACELRACLSRNAVVAGARRVTFDLVIANRDASVAASPRRRRRARSGRAEESTKASVRNYMAGRRAGEKDLRDVA